MNKEPPRISRWFLCIVQILRGGSFEGEQGRPLAAALLACLLGSESPDAIILADLS